MKLKALPYYFYFILVCFSLSCGQLKEPDFKEIENVKITKFGLTESAITLDLRYFNNNKFRMKLKNAEGDAWLENNFLGHFTMDTLIHIPSTGDFRIPIKMKVDMAKILKNSLLTLLAKEVKIRVEGKARVGKGLIYINYPIRYEGMQNLEKLLR